jgi:histone H3/H4
MNKTDAQTQVQTLRRLIREYIDCVTGWSPGNCNALRNAVKSIAASMSSELARDALRLIGTEDYEP